ncbi:hypothetical protein DID78_04545 [Candidatus Marinamargulisbacteria bacterium SCGC AG-343-D04]|nr:hypothetical protein DID78_04545 [Candidatus Marinamargulisbacteria bacterium SCGC AG-343-D04]
MKESPIKETEIKIKNPNKFDLELSFEVALKKIRKWKKCSIIANFLGEYQAESCESNKSKTASIISTIANELIENAIKFTDNNHRNIKISIKERAKTIFIETENITSIDHINNLNSTIENINTQKNKDKLIIDKILENNSDEKSNSEIGILSLVSHFGCSIFTHVKDEDLGKDIKKLTTTVSISNLVPT